MMIIAEGSLLPGASPKALHYLMYLCNAIGSNAGQTSLSASNFVHIPKSTITYTHYHPLYSYIIILFIPFGTTSLNKNRGYYCKILARLKYLFILQ